MCQLTYANFHDTTLNGLVCYLLALIGSEKHNDGCGFVCSDDSVWKSAMAAKNISNLGEIINTNISDNRPVPFHIRRATFGIEISKENSHPFTGKYYTLMHNGTLVPANGEETKNKKRDSDSYQFLKVLDETKNDNPKMKFNDIFNKTMEGFSGKFAFIIRETKTGHDFVIRGKTAELWISHLKIDGQRVGYVINTSKETMRDAFGIFVNIAGILTGKRHEFTEPTLLKQETIYVAKDDDVKEIGETKEKTPVKVESPTAITYFDNHSNKPSTKSSGITHISTKSTSIGQLVRSSVRIYEFLKGNSLSLLDLQIIFHTMSGLSLLELTQEDLDAFTDHLLPKLAAAKPVRNRVKKLLDGKPFPIELYQKHNLEYPWTLNKGVDILKILGESSD